MSEHTNQCARCAKVFGDIEPAAVCGACLRAELSALRAQSEAAADAALALAEEHARLKVERDELINAAEAAMARCRTDCTTDSYCGRCEPLAMVLLKAVSR